MLSLRSSRMLVKPALLLFIVAAFTRLYFQLSNIARFGILHYMAIDSPAANGFSPTFTTLSLPRRTLQEIYMSDYRLKTMNYTPNPYVAEMLSSCRHARNPHTNHIRLLDTMIFTISMIPSASNASREEFRGNQYFNPAFIPLPAYVESATGVSYRYLLISRLVTSGHHQESHICLADICTRSTSSTRDHPCAPDDQEVLGLGDGMRCVTAPEKVNIPPTPAKLCKSAWKVFPDIPGFHDPRVFWSGKGEPLIEVNSGSMYGCIGLWMQDLRSIYPVLDKILRRTDTGLDDTGGHQTRSVQTRKSYTKLTELTRNPQTSRGDVEKNWVIFFPSADEALVQYDFVGKARSYTPSRYLPAQDATSDSKHSLAITNAEVGLFDQPITDGSDLIVETVGLDNESLVLHQPRRDQESWPNESAVSSTSTQRQIPRKSLPSLHGIRNGRTISRLLSHGLTTQNLTSPLEKSCFDHAHHLHLHDSFDNVGHWHQGSNSLRLIFCTRSQFRSRGCVSSSLSHKEDNSSKLSQHSYETLLQDEGAMLHFSIVHRKFSNVWDLPMRYERYVLVWEARAPFQLIAISKHPIVFGGERARPWSLGEDIGWDRSNRHEHVNSTLMNDVEKETIEESETYFTYTPSIAWVWRPRDEDESFHRQRGHDDLGTGFIDDELIIGIGMDDLSQGYAQIRAEELLTCMRMCSHSAA